MSPHDRCSEIWHVCDVENVTIYAKFATIYALSCGEKMSTKVHLWRKNDKYEVWTTAKKIPKMNFKRDDFKRPVCCFSTQFSNNFRLTPTNPLAIHVVLSSEKYMLLIVDYLD